MFDALAATEKTVDQQFHIDVSLACPSSLRTNIPFYFCYVYFHTLIDCFLVIPCIQIEFYYKLQLHRLTPRSQGIEPTMKH